MKRAIFLTLLACMVFTLAKSITEQYLNGYNNGECAAEYTHTGAVYEMCIGGHVFTFCEY